MKRDIVLKICAFVLTNGGLVQPRGEHVKIVILIML